MPKPFPTPVGAAWRACRVALTSRNQPTGLVKDVTHAQDGGQQ